MKIPLLLFCLIIASGLQIAKAQQGTALPDSARKVMLAKRDARFFSLSRKEQKEFKEQRFPATSDYFKPLAGRTTKPELLNDSVYVQTYRMAAFYSSLNAPEPPTLKGILTAPLPKFGAPKVDYDSPIQQQAQKDAHKFRLDDKRIIEFKRRQYANTSDNFKPTIKYTADTALLKDSLYVHTFRNEAFDRALDQPENAKAHAFVMGTIAVVSAVALVLIIGNLH